MASTTELTVGLPDGRKIGLAEYGSAGGRPVLFFHGSPDSRLSAAILAGAADRNAVRLIALDRPGMGLSDPEPRRRLVDWPADVDCVLDRLGVGKVGLVGVSAGAAYLYAFSFRFPERVLAASVVSGVGPPAVLKGLRPALVRFMLRIPGMGKLMFNSVAVAARRDPDHYVVPGLVAADLRALADWGVRRAWIDGLLEAYRAGPGGVVLDQRLQLSGWGFELSQVGTAVRLWHGEDDGVVPVAVARRIAASLGNGSLTEIAGEGHLSILVQHALPILADLASAMDNPERV
jgi:pimeloyl-ACP methyl ester carboxylesterase